MRPLILVALAWSASSAHAGTALEDAFTCYDGVDQIGVDADYPWESAWSGDSWTSVGFDGVGPTVSDTTGTIGATVDANQNFLLTGHPTYMATGQRVILNHGSGALGLVSAYDGAGGFYACMAAVDIAPGCGMSEMVPGVYLYRVDTATDCTAGAPIACRTPPRVRLPTRPTACSSPTRTAR